MILFVPLAVIAAIVVVTAWVEFREVVSEVKVLNPEGDNNRRKAKAWLSKEHLNKARDLKTGEFLRQYGSKITFEKVPLYQAMRRPQPYIEPPKPKKPTLVTRMMRAIVGD